jgi:hypothetical protein
MSRNRIGNGPADDASSDLLAFSLTLSKLLPVFLFSHDRDVMVRWCKARSWVDNGLAGDVVMDLLTLELAIAYLTERADDLLGPARPPGEAPGPCRT